MIEPMFGKRWPSLPLTNEERVAKWQPVYGGFRNSEEPVAERNKEVVAPPPKKESSPCQL